MVFKGLYRIRGKEGEPNKVAVTDGDRIIDDIEEKDYHLTIGRPPLEDLPWLGEDNQHK